MADLILLPGKFTIIAEIPLRYSTVRVATVFTDTDSLFIFPLLFIEHSLQQLLPSKLFFFIFIPCVATRQTDGVLVKNWNLAESAA